jgi:hypothetical protein
MPMARSYRNPIFAADIRELRGVVSEHTDRDRCDGTPVFRVGHVSGGGDVAFLSLPIILADHADAAAKVLLNSWAPRMEKPPDKRKRAALAGDPNSATWKQSHPTETAEFIQAKLLSRQFGLAPATASTVASLAFGMAR